jgi:hypothetical protein
MADEGVSRKGEEVWTIPKGGMDSLGVKDLPAIPLGKMYKLGPSIIVLGIALGGGELIMWPRLTAQYGAGLMWLAIIGVSLQWFINVELGRYTIATGESFFTGCSRAWKGFGWFWFASAILIYMWPGWAATGATALDVLLGGTGANWRWWAEFTLVLTAVILLGGPVVYNSVEKVSMFFMGATAVILVITISIVITPAGVKSMAKGILFNSGGDWWLPPGINLFALFGAVIYAGAGSLGNLSYTFAVQQKQWGMASHIGRVTSPITGKLEPVPTAGNVFETSEKNMDLWNKWYKVMRNDVTIYFWLANIVGIVLLAHGALEVLHPAGLVPKGAQIAVTQANMLASKAGEFGRVIFLAMSFFIMYSSQLVALDLGSRMISEILYTHTNLNEKYSLRGIYTIALLALLVFAGCALWIPTQPFILFLMGAVLGGFTMAVYSPMLLFMNTKFLPKEIQPSTFIKVGLAIASAIYIIFSIVVILNKVFGVGA